MSGDGIARELAGPDRPLSIVEMAGVLGRLCWVELQGFRILGEMAAGAGHLDPTSAVFSSSASMAHGWRACQLEALLPVSTGLPSPEEVTGPGGEAVAGFCEAMATWGAAGPEELYASASAWYHVLGDGYQLRAAQLRQESDGPISRALSRLIADVSAVARSIPRPSPVPVREA